MSTLAEHRTHDPPGPPRTWLFGNLKEFGRDQLGAMTRWAREYGDLVSARFGPRRVVFANHPDLVEEVLVKQNRKFIKHYRLRQTKRTLGQGLLTSEGRVLAQPAQARPASVPSRADRRLCPSSWWITPSECSSHGQTARCATSRTT